MIKVTLDTNTLISGLFWSGSPRKILDLARERRVVICLNASILREFVRVLRYPKFGISEDEIKPLLAELVSISSIVPEICTQSFIPEDPADDMVIRCAIDSGANFIVSGDHHILECKAEIGAKITNATNFLADFSVMP